MSQHSMGARAQARMKQLLDRVRGSNYYADPRQYWENRHNTYGAQLEGVGSLSLDEDLNEQEYALKWEHVRDVLESARGRSAPS